MKAPLLAIILSLAACAAALAEPPYHTPAPTGDHSKHCGIDTFDSSGVEYYAPKDRFFNLADQSYIEVFSPNCALLATTDPFTCSGTGGDHEGITTVSPYSDVIIIQSENGGGICTVDADDIDDGGSVTVLQNFDWPAGDTDCGSGVPSAGGSEGVTFVPDSRLAGVCRYAGYLLATDQGGSPGFIYKYCIHPTNATLDCLARYAKPSCNGSTEVSGMEYDYENRLLYLQSDNGDATCVVYADSIGTVLKTIPDPVTGRGGTINTFEGDAFGGGKFAYSDDGTGATPIDPGDPYNGLWLFNDTYGNVYVPDPDAPTAATRYVAASGTCSHNLMGAPHTDVGSGFIASGVDLATRCAASVTAGCTAAQPCCTVMAAVAKATASGDIIDVHMGTFTEPTNTTNTDDPCYNDTFAVVLSVPGVTLRGAPGDAPAPIIDGGGTGQGAALGVIQLAKRNTTVSGLTVQNHLVSHSDNDRVGCIEICPLLRGKCSNSSSLCYSSSSCSGGTCINPGGLCVGGTNNGLACTSDTINNQCPGGHCLASGFTVSNNVIHCDGDNTKLSPNQAIRIVGADDIEISGNAADGTYNEGIYAQDLPGGVGMHVHHNVFTQPITPPGGSGGFRGLQFETFGTLPPQTGSQGNGTPNNNDAQTGQLILHDNQILRTGTSTTVATLMGIFFREIHWNIFEWNDIIVGYPMCNYFQDDVDTPYPPAQFHVEKHKAWNVTCVASASVGPSPSQAFFWPDRYEANFTNMLIKGYPAIARFGSGTAITRSGNHPTSDGGVLHCPNNDTPVGGCPDGTHCLYGSTCPGGQACASGLIDTCGSTNQWFTSTGWCCPNRWDNPRAGYFNNSDLFGCVGTGCNGTGFYVPSVNDPLVTRFANVTGDPLLTTSPPLYHLQPGSPAIGLGVTNPLGGAAGSCSLTFRGQPVPCNLDADGNPRGSVSWDAGAYQNADSTPPATITDLDWSFRTPNAVKLAWTAPSDNVGATAYDIRYTALASCSGFNYGTATHWTGSPAPQTAGSPEAMYVPSLSPLTAYCFGVKTLDAAGNPSALATVVAVTSGTSSQFPTLRTLQGNRVAAHNRISGNAHGTATETTITTTRPLSFEAAQFLLEGDVDGATITISLRESRFQPGEADLFSSSGVVSGGRFVVNKPAVASVEPHSRLSLPPGSYVLRVASNSADSRGEISGEISMARSAF